MLTYCVAVEPPVKAMENPEAIVADDAMERLSFRERKRVAVFLDIPNMETSSHAQGVTFDPRGLREMARSFGRVVVARAYGFASPNRPVTRGVFLSVQAGFEFVPRVVIEEGKKDIDTQMAVDLAEMALCDRADVLVVCSGDSDYLPSLRVIRRLGKRAVVVGVQDCSSAYLRAEADTQLLIRKEGQELEISGAPALEVPRAPLVRELSR